MQIGIVGLPYSGKTTLFQTITNSHLEPEALTKRESNQAIVKVPDSRLDKLTEIFNPKKTVNATIEVVDVVGLQKGDSKGSQFAANFTAKVGKNDALILVVRGFDDPTVPNPEETVNMSRDIDIFFSELLISDMAFIENRLEKLESNLRKKPDDSTKKELAVFKKWNEHIMQEKALRELDFEEDEKRYLKNYNLLTAKPVLIALNLDEKDLKKSQEIEAEVAKRFAGKNIVLTSFPAKIELELADLEEEEKTAFMEDYGITESALSKILSCSYDLLGLQSFLTAGDDECRAWTIKKGMTAQEAAGVIHTDFYNKFIRAEVVGYQDFIDCGSFHIAKEKGKWRLEGKEYIVADGDIISVRHG